MARKPEQELALTTATVMLSPGDVLGGYEIEDLIGVGGMAIVYRARQRSLGGRQVALKVLATDRLADESFRERFRREGEHAARLDHPHIVPVYDAGEADGRLYLAMRLIEGETLARRIAHGALSPSQTIALLGPVADALDLAHAAHLVHRDVKPQNILLDRLGHPYLADFGIAKSASSMSVGMSLTHTGAFVGSIHYASPEQILGDEPTGGSDVYALTAVLYQCLAGQVPFPYDTDVRVLGAHITQPPPRFSKSGPDSLRAVDPVIARGMAKDPRDRYATATALIDAAVMSLAAVLDEPQVEPRVRPSRGGAPALRATQLSPLPPAKPTRRGTPVGRSSAPTRPSPARRRGSPVARVVGWLDAAACWIAGLPQASGERSRHS
jgi:serine/threonine-protein kinase